MHFKIGIFSWDILRKQKLDFRKVIDFINLFFERKIYSADFSNLKLSNKITITERKDVTNLILM